MKSDEFSFFNQQLAAMVRDGIPLETALRRLCADMRRGRLRSELEKLEADLAKGRPVREAVAARQLPDLYRQMLEVGAQSNNLPAVLTLLADHYQRRHVVWTRLKGLMVYPAIVFIGAFLLSCFLSLILTTVAKASALRDFGFERGFEGGVPVFVGIWIAPVILGLAVVVLSVAVMSPRARRALRWRLPAFKEASLAQVASALALMLKNGVPLDNALALLERMERGTPAARNSPSGGGGWLPAWAGFPNWRRTAGFSRHFSFGQFHRHTRIWPPVFRTPPKPINPAPTTAPNCCFIRPCHARSWRWAR